ncbi:MAG: hypothetical protein A3K68_04465 [Euryarchaeota archaeon RBG_16_68_13]|nr:MAG: hypothetical protein A3K68_04465 [Euryarchaeota archaeon RBG_16_68_13]
MWEYFWVLVALGLIGAWTLGVFFLQKRGLLEPRGLHAAGPFIMWKTRRGRDFLDRLSRPNRFWRVFGDASLVIVGLTMAGTTLLLVWEATLVQSPAVRQNPPSPDLLLGLPGINRLIPLGYGIFGLAIAIVLHEFAHGVLARVAKVNIRSLGIILFIFPIGAFVEPEEEEMKVLPRRDRARLYAVGPATNILLAILFAFLFSSMMSSSVTPVHEGVGIIGFSEPDSPARDAGLQPYTIITSFNGAEIRSYAEFVRAKEATVANQVVPVTTYDGTSYAYYDVTLLSDGAGGSLLGIYGIDTSTEYYYPLSNPDRFGGVPNAILTYISLPFAGRAPIQDPAARFYEIQGPLAVLPAEAFWLLANAFYWLFWLNVMLGATNALPAVPLDGGYIFKDGLESLVVRLRRGLAAEARDRVVRNVSYVFALFILALILWQLIGPRI